MSVWSATDSGQCEAIEHLLLVAKVSDKSVDFENRFALKSAAVTCVRFPGRPSHSIVAEVGPESLDLSGDAENEQELRDATAALAPLVAELGSESPDMPGNGNRACTTR